MYSVSTGIIKCLAVPFFPQIFNSP